MSYFGTSFKMILLFYNFSEPNFYALIASQLALRARSKSIETARERASAVEPLEAVMKQVLESEMLQNPTSGRHLGRVMDELRLDLVSRLI